MLNQIECAGLCVSGVSRIRLLTESGVPDLSAEREPLSGQRCGRVADSGVAAGVRTVQALLAKLGTSYVVAALNRNE